MTAMKEWVTSALERERICRRGGAEYLGCQDGLVYFNDPLTKSTLTIDLPNFSRAALAKRLAESRDEFGIGCRPRRPDRRFQKRFACATARS